MLNAKINLNGIEWTLTGDKEEIVYALRNATSTSIPTEKEIIGKVGSFINHEIINTPSRLVQNIAGSNAQTTQPTGTAKYSKEDMIGMYQYLSTHGTYSIKQFQITRGGKTNPVQYKVCLVFDELKQRYCWYNPKTEDTYLQTFSIDDTITKIKNSESGFSLLHSVAARITEKMNVVDGLKKIVAEKKDPFPTDKKITFKNYETKKKPHHSINVPRVKGRFVKKS